MSRSFPYTIPLESWIDSFVDWLVTNFRPLFQALKIPIEYLLNGLTEFFLWIPPFIFLPLLFLVAWKISGWKRALFSVASFALIGFLGLWNEAMVTLAMLFSSLFISLIIGIPVGIASSKSSLLEAILQPILNTMQTTPAFVYLIPVVMLFSVGTVAGVIATIIFSLPPLIRLTSLGIKQVPRELKEAAISFGATKWEVLYKVELPLAYKTILEGVNETIMLSLSMVVIASMIGAGGLGVPVFKGLNSLQVGLAAIGGVSIVLMAMVFETLMRGISKEENSE